MVERSLADRVLGFLEEGWHHAAIRTLAEAVEDQGRRLDELERDDPPSREQVRIVPPSQGGS
jgi:hypothetical protein